MTRIYKTIRAIPGRPGYAQQVGLKYTKTASGRRSYIPGTGPRGPRRGYKPRVTGPFAQKVNTVISRSRETKLAIGPPLAYTTNDALDQWTTFSTAITNVGEIYTLIPAVSQGVGDYQRVGNTIQPVSLTTKVNVACVARSTNSISIYAHIFFLTSKNVKDWKLTAAVPITSMLDKGDGTNVDFDGRSYNAMLPINKSEFNVIAHKKILLQKGANNPNSIYQQDETASSDTFKHFANFSQRIPLPKELLYLNNSETRPTNAFPFMVMGFTATDQFGGDATSILLLKVQAQSHLYYKDA